jgi:hypothetical protein
VSGTFQSRLHGARLCLLWLCISMTGPAAAETNVDTGEKAVDKHHLFLSRQILRGAEAINSFLIEAFREHDERESELIRRFYGDRLSAYDVEGTHIRVTPRATFSERSDHRYNVDFSVRLRLGDLSERLTIFADSYDTDHDTMEEIFSDRYRRELDRERSEGPTAGLTYLLRDRVTHQLSLSGGLRFRPEPSPRLRLRGKVRKAFDVWRAEFAQSVFWDRADGFGEKSQIKFDRPIGDTYLFRLSSSAVWSELSRGVDWGHFVSYYGFFSARRSAAIKAGLRGHTHPSIATEQYLVRVPYRQRVLRDWLFIEIEPGLDFFREDDWETAPLINLKLDIIIGSFERTQP